MGGGGRTAVQGGGGETAGAHHDGDQQFCVPRTEPRVCAAPGSGPSHGPRLHARPRAPPTPRGAGRGARRKRMLPFEVGALCWGLGREGRGVRSRTREWHQRHVVALHLAVAFRPEPENEMGPLFRPLEIPTMEKWLHNLFSGLFSETEHFQTMATRQKCSNLFECSPGPNNDWAPNPDSEANLVL